jgi:hypothetical protein
VNHIRIDDEQSSGLIKGISFGRLKPGTTVRKTLILVSTGGAGDRALDLSFQSVVPDESVPLDKLVVPETPTALGDTCEVLQALVVPTVAPFKTEQAIAYRRASRTTPGLLDLATFESDYWDDADGGEAVVSTSFACAGPWGVEVDSCKLVREVGVGTCS